MTAEPTAAREPAPCGTYPAAQKHLRDGTPRHQLDPACTAALRAYQADAARRARANRKKATP